MIFTDVEEQHLSTLFAEEKLFSSLLPLRLTTVAAGTSCYGYILYVVSVQLGAVRKGPDTEINHPECYVLGVKPDETE